MPKWWMRAACVTPTSSAIARRLVRPAPLFAEHNREILHEAGLDDDAIEALYAAGATADEPTPPE